jgi:hypothetical protein
MILSIIKNSTSSPSSLSSVSLGKSWLNTIIIDFSLFSESGKMGGMVLCKNVV